MPKLFISYSSHDRPTARMIQNQLEQGGIEVWRDERSIEDDWSREIATALASSNVIVLLWSKAADQSEWIRHEWLTARALDKNIQVIALPGAPDLPVALENLHWIALKSRATASVKTGCNSLLRKLGRERQAPAWDFGILPGHYYVPFNTNPQFAGRRGDLVDLYLALIGNLNKLGLRQVGLVGMGGVGKTQIAIEFAARFSFAFGGVYWVQAANPRRWRGEFSALARDQLGLPVTVELGQDTDRAYLKALQGYFKKNRGILVIMDNVEDPQELNSTTHLGGMSPLSLGCDLLFTTRQDFEIPGVEKQRVGMLSEDDSMRLLSSYCSVPEQELGTAKDICRALGLLPLAIVLAGTYLREYGHVTSFDNYLRQLSRNRLAAIDVGSVSPEQLATRHSAAVRKTLKDQWRKLRGKTARRLFELAGQMGEAEIIPCNRLGMLAGMGSERMSLRKPLADAVSKLARLSLVERIDAAGGSIRLHPLVWEFARRLVPARERAGFRRDAAVCLAKKNLKYARLYEELTTRGVHQVLGDLSLALEWVGRRNAIRSDLSFIHEAVRMSAAALGEDPREAPAQLITRLANVETPAIGKFRAEAVRVAERPWLYPKTPSLTPAGTALRRTLRHDSITALACTPDGRFAVTGSIEGSIKIWDLESGTEWAERSVDGEIADAVISQDGQTAVLACSNGPIIAMRIPDGGLVAEAYGYSHGIYTKVRTNEDGSEAVILIYEGEISAWDLRRQKRSRRVSKKSKYGYAPRSTAITPDGRRAVLGFKDGLLRIYEPLKSRDKDEIRIPDTNLRPLALSPDGSFVLTTRIVDYEYTLLVMWDLLSGDEVWERVLEYDEVPVKIAISADGSTIVGVTETKRVVFWALATGEPLWATPDTDDFDESDLVVSADGRTALVGTDDGELAAWRIGRKNPLFQLRAHGLDASNLALLPDGGRALSASIDGSLRVWDLTGKRTLAPSPPHSRGAFDVAVSENGRHGISVGADNAVLFWSLESGAFHRIDTVHTQRVLRVEMSADGRIAVTSSDEPWLAVWDVTHRRLLCRLEGHTKDVRCMAMTPDARVLVTGSRDNTIRVWDVLNGELVNVMTERGKYGVTGIAISARGDLAISCTGDAAVGVWDLVDGTQIRRYWEHTDGVWDVALSADGGTAATTTNDEILHVWSVTSGRTLHVLDGYEDVIMTPDARLALTRAEYESGDLLLWDLRRGKLRHVLEGHHDKSRFCVTPDGRFAVSSGMDHTVRLWDLQTGNMLAGLMLDFTPRGIAVTPDAKRIMTCDDGGYVHILEPRLPY